MNAVNELNSNDTESEESKFDNPTVFNTKSEDSILPSDNTWLPCGTGELTSILPSIRGNNDEKSGEEVDLDDKDLDKPISSSDLSDPSRNIWIVTTAALPWRTGTAINPFLRALYLVKRRLDYKRSQKNDDIKVGKVTLVIPWLESRKDSIKLLGSVITKSGDEGKAEQTAWMKNYAVFQCDLAEEFQHLNIMYYSAAYWSVFGSIFPTVDICSLIPDDEADVAILEEPEHLCWFRTPSINPTSSSPNNFSIETNDDVFTASDDAPRREECKVVSEKERDLGWAHKFNFVVGVIHTNYTAYLKQYGIGSTIFAAPVLHAMSVMVTKAYCHKLIRLSDVIPSYAKEKEITCNVHGVRNDFLSDSCDQSSPNPSTICHHDDGIECPQIYFIGKLLWAKGFDILLKVQELYRSGDADRKYFPIDVYGDGPDSRAIQRAFHGRLPSSTFDRDSDSEDDDNNQIATSNSEPNVFSSPLSLREQLHAMLKRQDNEYSSKPYSETINYLNMGFEIVPEDIEFPLHSSDEISYVMEKRESQSDKNAKLDAISILGDISEKSINTGIATTIAVKNLADSAIKTGLAMVVSKEESEPFGNDNDDSPVTTSYVFDPPKSLFELRRQSIPARFLGVKDHASLKRMSYKIFLNPSVTEVLCTTTAEALAMGKFVIIPDHPSNTFFLQFPNCLSYKSISECVEKLIWAMNNDPQPLSAEHTHIFTWEAATDRLIESSLVTKRDAMEKNEYGLDKSDARIAWLHSDVGKKSLFITSLFHKKGVTNGASKSVKSDDNVSSST